MQRQTMRIDFDIKNQVKAPFRYKQGEEDKNGIEFELVNIELSGLSGAVYATTPSEVKLEPQALVISGNKGIYIPPTNEAGDYKLELVVMNTNGKTKSADVVMTVVDSMSATIGDYETLYTQIVRKDAEYTSNENTRISNENTRIVNENARKSAETNRVASMTDIEKRFSSLTTAQQQQAEVADSRTDFNGVVHANLKTRLDNDFNELASKIPTDIAFDGYESVTTNDTLYGDVKNATLTGQTLVNLAKKGDVESEGNESSYPTIATNYLPELKAGLTLTVFVDVENLGSKTSSFVILSTTNTNQIFNTPKLNGKMIFKCVYTQTGNIGSISRLAMRTGNVEKVTWKNIMLLEGDHTDKPLEFFEGLKSAEVSEIESTNIDKTKSSKTTLSEPVTLRSLPNGVADTYDVDTGILTRRCGEVVLDGSESWASLWQNDPLLDPSLIGFNCTGLQTSKVTHVANCDKFKTFSTGGAMLNSKSECLGTYSNNTPIIIAKSKLATPDIAGFKAWLAQNPTTVVYQLATPTTEYIENNGQLRSYDSQTTVFANSIVPVKISGNIPVNYASTLAKTLMRVDELKEENKKLLETIETLSNDVNQIHAFMYAMSNTTLEE